jgi:thymidylate kinase
MKKNKKSLSANRQGKFIAIYGINGIGKTTQTERLVAYLQSKVKNAVRLKYPIYDLEPEGPFIYKYLRDPKFRKKNNISTHELQKKYADNRFRYEKELNRRLKNGEWIVAEDYLGTGIAWGLTWGGDLEYLEKINKKLLQPDVSILMHGDRFKTAIEKDHRNEMEEERIMICKNLHFLLANRYNWCIIRANQEAEKVQLGIRRIVNNKLF